MAETGYELNIKPGIVRIGERALFEDDGGDNNDDHENDCINEGEYAIFGSARTILYHPYYGTFEL